MDLGKEMVQIQLRREFIEMTMTNVYGLIEKINDVLNQMIGLEGERFEAMRVDLLDVREGLYVIEQHQSEN